MENTLKNKATLEVLWWLFTAVVVVAVIFPIWNNLTTYPFLIPNIVFIVVFITLTRYVFLLKHTVLAKMQGIKVAIVLVSIPIIFMLIERLSGFQNYLDEEGLNKFLPMMNLDEQQTMINYIKSEMLLFGVGSVIIAVIFPFRMVLSVWRNRNTNQV